MLPSGIVYNYSFANLREMAQEKPPGVSHEYLEPAKIIKKINRAPRLLLTY